MSRTHHATYWSYQQQNMMFKRACIHTSIPMQLGLSPCCRAVGGTDAQRGPERPRYIDLHREGQRGRAWIEQACPALGWLAGWGAGWQVWRKVKCLISLFMFLVIRHYIHTYIHRLLICSPLRSSGHRPQNDTNIHKPNNSQMTLCECSSHVRANAKFGGRPWESWQSCYQGYIDVHI